MAELAEEPAINKAAEEEGDEGDKRTFKKMCHCIIENAFLTYSILMASVMSFLAGTTLSYSSFLLFDVSELQNPQLRFSTMLEGIFAVSMQAQQ